jgi:hypothetical protein
MSITILDAQLLPPQAQFDKDGSLIRSQVNSQLYVFEHACVSTRNEKVVGMVRPEPGKEHCEHLSRQVQRAWKIDKKTGKITEVSPQGISCHWVTSLSCNAY